MITSPGVPRLRIGLFFAKMKWRTAENAVEERKWRRIMG
jgi:hypothetical protein